MRKKCKRIAGRLIEESFPFLKDKKIYLLVMKLRFYAFSLWIPPFFRFIVISTRTKDFNDNVITGILAHELCHQERYIRMGILSYLKFAFMFLISKSIRANEETSTDMLTIEKGYARQLYELSEITNNDPIHEKINMYYLSPEGIKSYAVMMKKW